MKDKKKQERKAYPKGEAFGKGATQKMMSIRIDYGLINWLKSKPNMGRYINNLIKSDIKHAWVDDEHTEDIQKAEDWDI